MSAALSSSSASVACSSRSSTEWIGTCLQIDRRFSVVSALLGKNTYSVTVNPGIDYAFIVALVVILDEMHYQR